MLTIMDPRATHTCQGFGRREFLRVGGLSLGGLALPQLLATQAAAKSRNAHIRRKSVVLLFLSGGPPHIELFDPKMTAPSEIRSITGEVKTKSPGVTFGATFPKLAAMSDRISVVRSYGSGNGGHTYDPVTTAGNPLKASASSLFARVAGNNHPATGMPTNVLVKPEAVMADLKLGRNFESSALPSLTTAGELGPTFAAFDPSGGGTLQADMKLKIKGEHLDDRRQLLGSLDRIRRRVDVSGQIDGADQYQQQAFDVISRGVANAFDLAKEDPKTIAKYDTSGLFKQEDLQRFNDMRRVSNQLGKQMLLARRLCEAGCGFVTVSDCGWDFHANNNSPKGMTGIWPMGNQVDHAVSAFLDDVQQRGLSDDILLVVTGEMGRSPRINNGGGRDHYGNLTSLLFAGGGLRMGQVVGQSDSQAGKPVTTPYGPKHLMSTLMHTLFDLGELRLVRGIPADVSKIIQDGEPIGELIA